MIDPAPVDSPTLGLAPIILGVSAAAIILLPLAAWLRSRATEKRIDRQTRDRLRR